MSDKLGKSISAEEFFQKTLEFQSKSVTTIQGHIQVIILAGYAAFFTLWSSMASSLPIKVMLISGGLMGLSLIVFLIWVVIGVIFLKYQQELILSEYHIGPVNLPERLQNAEKKVLNLRKKLMPFWKYVVIFSGLTAFISSSLLSFDSILISINKSSDQREKCRVYLEKFIGKSEI